MSYGGDEKRFIFIRNIGKKKNGETRRVAVCHCRWKGSAKRERWKNGARQ